jgi:hypothetical protein
MPIAGFKEGDRVLTPSRREATVKSVYRAGGRERVKVAYYGAALADRTFDASALKLDERSRNDA